MARWPDGDYIGIAFEVGEGCGDVVARYCGPCGTQQQSRLIRIRPISNGTEDGACYWEAEVWECTVCGHGGQVIRPLFVTKRSKANAALT